MYAGPPIYAGAPLGVRTTLSGDCANTIELPLASNAVASTTLFNAVINLLQRVLKRPRPLTTAWNEAFQGGIQT